MLVLAQPLELFAGVVGREVHVVDAGLVIIAF
jgi:hypothetical protein